MIFQKCSRSSRSSSSSVLRVAAAAAESTATEPRRPAENCTSTSPLPSRPPPPPPPSSRSREAGGERRRRRCIAAAARSLARLRLAAKESVVAAVRPSSRHAPCSRCAPPPPASGLQPRGMLRRVRTAPRPGAQDQARGRRPAAAACAHWLPALGDGA